MNKNNVIIACLILCYMLCICESLVAGTRRLVIHNRMAFWQEFDISSYDSTHFALLRELPPDTAIAYYGYIGKNGAVVKVNKSWRTEYPDEDMYARDLNFKNLFIRKGIVVSILYLFLLVTVLGVPFLLYRDTKHGVCSQIVDDNSFVLCSDKQRFANMMYDFLTYVFCLRINFVLSLICYFIAGVPYIDVNSIAIFFVSSPIRTWFIFCYFFYMEYFYGRTLGKFLTKSIVVDEQGNKPTAKAILIRTLCRLIPFDCLSFLFYEEERAQGHCIFWHDKLSHTRVVQNMQSN